MIDCLALSIYTASTGTRVGAFLIDTSFVLSTFRTDGTFWPATGWTTYIVWQARTNSLPIKLSTLTIGPTRARVTWV